MRLDERRRTTPSYSDLLPASPRASEAARASSRKLGTRCEMALRRELWRRGLRYRVAVAALPGCPDIVFSRARVVVFCDGDFWHGRGLGARLAKLEGGSNAAYWVAKLRANVERDRRNTVALQAAGWRVLRYWEGDILKDAGRIASVISAAIAEAMPPQRP